MSKTNNGANLGFEKQMQAAGLLDLMENAHG
jgi:hypothetical protein